VAQYRRHTFILEDPNSLRHFGTKGMKWGYNDGRRNGNRLADDQYKLASSYAYSGNRLEKTAYADANGVGKTSYRAEPNGSFTKITTRTGILGGSSNSQDTPKPTAADERALKTYKANEQRYEASKSIDYAIGHLAGKTVHDVQKIISPGKSKVDSLLSKVKSGNSANDGKKVISDTMNKAKKAASDIASKAKKAAKPVIDDVKDSANQVTNKAKSYYYQEKMNRSESAKDKAENWAKSKAAEAKSEAHRLRKKARKTIREYS